MATSTIRYEIRPSKIHHGRFAVVKLKGRLDLGYIATGLSRSDAGLFKRTKEQDNLKHTAKAKAERRENRAGAQLRFDMDNAGSD